MHHVRRTLRSIPRQWTMTRRRRSPHAAHLKRSTSILFAVPRKVSHTGSIGGKSQFPEGSFHVRGNKDGGTHRGKVFRTRRQLYENARGKGGIEKPRTSSSSSAVRIGRAGGKFINFFPLLPSPTSSSSSSSREPNPNNPISDIFNFQTFRPLIVPGCDLSTMELNMLSLLYFLLLLSLPSLGLYMYLGPF